MYTWWTLNCECGTGRVVWGAKARPVACRADQHCLLHTAHITCTSTRAPAPRHAHRCRPGRLHGHRHGQHLRCLPESALLGLKAKGREQAIVGPGAPDARLKQARVRQQIGGHKGPIRMPPNSYALICIMHRTRQR